ncbi:uncharacterized protein LOC143248934 [Tachypleus tridentatus]|uniref:uncharacterized protein LOC143248934 n=1 Tax=Tachypleus tridentatus TaxID=6853 RepID=UPI003FD58D52
MSVVTETIGSDESHVRALTSASMTSLLTACKLNDHAETRILLESERYLVAIRDKSGKTALHYCTENRDTVCADLILNTEPTLINEQDEEGYTALHLSVISGNKVMTEYLIGKGADVNSVDNDLHTCVHWATVCGELECLDILIDAGGNPAMPDIHGAYPSHYASQMCGFNNEMRNDTKRGLAALHALLARGMNVNVQDKDGRQPLLWAASAGSSDAIISLVNAGAMVSAEDKDGLTALHCAASRGHLNCLEALINVCGAEVDTIDSNGCTALFYAVTLGHSDCTKLLLQYGADSNRQDRKGRTAAHCGAAKGQLETLSILGSNGGNLWMANIRGDVPLHEAVQSGRKDLVLWLLSLNPNAANAQNYNGRTALHVAAFENNEEMCKILLDYKANVSAILRTSKGQLMTPLDIALRKGFEKCTKYLSLRGGVAASKLLENQNISGSFIDHLEDTPSKKITPPEESFSSSYVNKVDHMSLESDFDNRGMRSESVQTDQCRREKQDANVQVELSVLTHQGDLNIATVKEIEEQYYIKKSIESDSLAGTTGSKEREQKEMRQAIITNMTVTTSNDNKNRKKGKQRDEYEMYETSDENGAGGSKRTRIQQKDSHKNSLFGDKYNSGSLEDHENNKNAVRRKTKKTKTKEPYKQRIQYICKADGERKDLTSDDTISDKNDEHSQRANKNKKGKKDRNVSENKEGANENGSVESETQRQKRFSGNHEGHNEIEEPLEENNYEGNKEESKMTQTKMKNDSERKKYKEKECSRNEEDVNNVEDNQKLKKVESSHGKENIKIEKHINELKAQNFEEETETKTDVNKNDRNEYQKSTKYKRINGQEAINFQTSSLEEEENDKGSLQNHGKNEVRKVSTNLKYIQDSEKNILQESSENELGLADSEISSVTEETSSSETSSETESENSFNSGIQTLEKQNNIRWSLDNTDTSINKSERSNVILETREWKEVLQHEEENFDDEDKSTKEEENENMKQIINDSKMNKKHNLFSVEDSIRQAQFSPIQPSENSIEILEQAVACNNHEEDSITQTDVSSLNEENEEPERVGEMRHKRRKKKKPVKTDVIYNEEDDSIMNHTRKYKTSSGRQFVRSKDRNPNVTHKSKLHTKGIVTQKKRASSFPSIELLKVQPNKRFNLNSASSSKNVSDDVTKKGFQSRKNLEKRLFDNLKELNKERSKNDPQNEVRVVQRSAKKLYRDMKGTGLPHFDGPYNFSKYEKYILDQIKLTSCQGNIPKIKNSEEKNSSEKLIIEIESATNPAMCTCSTFRCHHVTEIYGRRPMKSSLSKPNVASHFVLPTILPSSNGSKITLHASSENVSSNKYISPMKSTITTQKSQKIGSTRSSFVVSALSSETTKKERMKDGAFHQAKKKAE